MWVRKQWGVLLDCPVRQIQDLSFEVKTNFVCDTETTNFQKLIYVPTVYYDINISVNRGINLGINLLVLFYLTNVSSSLMTRYRTELLGVGDNW